MHSVLSTQYSVPTKSDLDLVNVFLNEILAGWGDEKSHHVTLAEPMLQAESD